MPNAQHRVVVDTVLRRMAQLHRAISGGKRRKPWEPEGELVEPNRPSTLSGGAAAELEFDD